MAPSLPLSLTDAIAAKVLTFSLRFKVYLEPSFPAIFSTSLAITLVEILPIESCYLQQMVILFLSIVDFF